MPDINDFPNELIVEIFSHFDLKTLTRCMRVNRLFKAITEHSTFDKIFFRTKVIIKPEDLINLDELQINPALDQLFYTCRSKINEANFLFFDEKPDGKPDVKSYYHELALIDSSAAKQNATEPAVTYIYLTPYGYDGVEVKSERAVTVQDLMQGLCDFYKHGYAYDRCHYFFEGFYKSKSSSEKVLVLRCRWGS